VGLLERPTPMSPSREPSPNRSGSPTDRPHRRRRKKEKDPHLHTDDTKTTKAKLEQLRLTRLIHRVLKATNSRRAKGSSEITDSSLLAPTTNHFEASY
jgi:hypothetical protein